MAQNQSFEDFVRQEKNKNKNLKLTQTVLDELRKKWKKLNADTQAEQASEEKSKELTPSEVTSYIAELDRIDKEAEQAAGTTTTTQQQTVPTRKVMVTNENLQAGATQAASAARRVEGGSEFAYYTGDMLVNKDGNVVRGPYTENDAETVFRELSMKGNTKLNEFLNTLYTHGYYMGKKPSNLAKSGQGFANEDFNAAVYFLEQANRKGLTYDAYLPAVEASAGTYGGGGGSTGSFSSKEDIAVYLRSAGFKYLGRPLTKEEIDAAAKRIQQEQMSRTSSTGGEESTSLSTSAMLAAQQAAPEEYASYSLGAALDRIYAKLGGE